MTYSKKKYLQFLKSCGVVAAGVTFYACNHDNDAFVNKHNNEKISPEEVIAIVNDKLESEFPNADKEGILNFFKDNIKFFKKDDDTINDFFSFINGDTNALNEFISGQEKLEDWSLKNLDLKGQQLKAEENKIKAQKEALKAAREERIKSQITEIKIELQTLQKELKEEEEALKSQKEDLKTKENELKRRKKENTDKQKVYKQKIQQLESSLKPQKTKTTKKKVKEVIVLEDTPKDENREEEFIVHNVTSGDEG